MRIPTWLLVLLLGAGIILVVVLMNNVVIQFRFVDGIMGAWQRYFTHR